MLLKQYEQAVLCRPVYVCVCVCVYGIPDGEINWTALQLII